MNLVKASDKAPTPSGINATELAISDAKATSGISPLVGAFPVFSDCWHQRSGRRPGLHSGATAAFGFRPPLRPNILQPSV